MIPLTDVHLQEPVESEQLRRRGLVRTAEMVGVCGGTTNGEDCGEV